jgi:DNA-3-methyladenine glycosylase
MSKLQADFYQREDVLLISRELLGKVLCTNFHGKLTSGIIVETEAYAGVTDKASHAYGGRRTKRTETMYAKGGSAYVYLCYGIHHLFNIVTNKENIPHAVLIRAIQPRDGIEIMLQRRNKKKVDQSLTTGPGSLTRALGITVKNSGTFLMDNLIWLEDQNINYTNQDILATPRVGVQYAGKDAQNPWRFQIENSPWVSTAS